jgi:hypothetical protein
VISISPSTSCSEQLPETLLRGGGGGVAFRMHVRIVGGHCILMEFSMHVPAFGATCMVVEVRILSGVVA